MCILYCHRYKFTTHSYIIVIFLIFIICSEIISKQCFYWVASCFFFILKMNENTICQTHQKETLRGTIFYGKSRSVMSREFQNGLIKVIQSDCIELISLYV